MRSGTLDRDPTISSAGKDTAAPLAFRDDVAVDDVVVTRCTDRRGAVR